MRILFIHDDFPGQYQRIVNHLAKDRNYELVSGSLSKNSNPTPIRRIEYTPHRLPHPDSHPALRYTERAVIHGQAALKAFLPLQRQGWKPDIILGHSGWGSGIFMKDLWPDAKYLAYFEWYYRTDAADVGFLDGGVSDVNEKMKIRMKNTAILQDFAAMDWGQCPTQFQATQFPEIFRNRLSILHDGVDTEFFSPNRQTELVVNGCKFRKGDPLVTYIARGMEPYRGFPQFIAAIAHLQKMNPHVHALIIGEDKVVYGLKRQDGQTFKHVALEENQLDLSRIHFVGTKPLHFLRDALRVSAAHIYLTVPFVLSWSMMEAMSTGAVVVGSDTGPLREMITDGENGILVPFHQPDELANTLNNILKHPNLYTCLGEAARKMILERYELSEMIGLYQNLIHAVASGNRPCYRTDLKVVRSD
ncbi:glycosyltransferase [Mesorhizobium sp. B2-5-9]|uniref:glycosyltransferase n=1 Tax=Mesorhizobium sp. B2-5-9 TaxID=2589921 RepID=UPI00112E0299|nr:glycosyltransferase [Mesorhizobium sp. B2-5-9]TPJ96769.1 glycosyltransferase [Mesorhizobium sp. B2-5-9]